MEDSKIYWGWAVFPNDLWHHGDSAPLLQSPTRKQAIALTALLSELCELYNAALAERRDAWNVCRKSLGLHEQMRELTQLRAVDAGERAFPVMIQRDPVRRVQHAFHASFAA